MQNVLEESVSQAQTRRVALVQRYQSLNMIFLNNFCLIETLLFYHLIESFLKI